MIYLPGPMPSGSRSGRTKYLFKSINRLEESTDVIDSVLGTAVLSLRAHCVVDPRAAAVETWEATVNAMQLSSALFAVTAMNEGTVEYRINRKLRNLPAAVGPRSSAEAGAAASRTTGNSPIDVESEYLPKHLLQHSWLGEFPT